MPPIEPGQRWRDCDPRGPERIVRIVWVDPVDVTNPKAIVENVKTGKRTRISLRRFKPTRTGYELVS